jgi:hypothetical protein
VGVRLAGERRESWRYPVRLKGLALPDRNYTAFGVEKWLDNSEVSVINKQSTTLFQTSNGAGSTP